MKEVGTLKELNVKPGDVVECVTDTGASGILTIGKYYNIGGSGCPIDNECEQFPWTWATFRIISRANTPKLWCDMTDAEKGALLLARFDGKVIEYLRYDGAWVKSDIFPGAYGTYRIRPEPPAPKVETVELYGRHDVQWVMERCDYDTHRITFNTIDGKPDCASIKMEAL